MRNPLHNWCVGGLSTGHVCQLGPDQMPVVGPQVTAGYSASGGAFDGEAVLNRHGAALLGICSGPGAGERLWYPQRAGQFSLCATVLREVGCDLHGNIISAMLKHVKSIARIAIISRTLNDG